MMGSKGTVLLGMSGGVDSSVAALLLQRAGYTVVGAFMKCFSETKNKLTGECHWADERRMALKIAALLGIELITLDFEEAYKKEVINPMFAAYKKGLTPNPDMTCNTLIKFPLLWKEAKKIGADYIATGHYARVRKDRNGYELLRGKDTTKDQSYFLAELTQADLSHTLFPIGNLRKQDVRRLAQKHRFPNWNKHGTRGICFVGNISMQRFLQQRLKKKEGKVMDPAGTILGTHEGVEFYTIGQKVGVHVGIYITKPKELAQARWYVAAKKKGNSLVIAPEGHSLLVRRDIILLKMHFISPLMKIPKKLQARIRHLGALYAGKLHLKAGRWHFTFARSVEFVTEGQYAVLYDGERVIGSGEIRIK